MQLFDDAGEVVEAKRRKTTSMQTDQLAILPCSNWLQADVNIHPLITAEVVDLEFVEALFEPASSDKRSRPTTRRYYSKGRWLTAESEVARRREETKQNELELEQKENKKTGKSIKTRGENRDGAKFKKKLLKLETKRHTDLEEQYTCVRWIERNR